MLWLALHLPALSLEAWAATLAPEQAGRPLALLHEHLVVLPDARAQALGVRPGMKRATAQALAPELLLGQADARRDAEALRAVAHVALAFSPSVAWATPADWRPSAAESTEQGCPPQPAPSPSLVGVRLEVQSCLRYFGGLQRLLARLQAQLAPLGHRVCIAAAPTAGGAALLAAAHPQAEPAGPANLQALQAQLDKVPLHHLGIDAAGSQALQAMGLATLADLHGLPRAGLARRLGPQILGRIDAARGRVPEAHVWLRLPQRFDTRLELMARADTSAQVLAGARMLLNRLVAWAGAHQARIVRFTLVMHHERPRGQAVPGPVHEGVKQTWGGPAFADEARHQADNQVPECSALEIAPAEPSADAGHLHCLLAEHLGRLLLPAPALELGLHCDRLQAGAAPNGELFASRRSREEGLGRLVERLQARLGREQVLQFSAVADHRPEHGTRWRPAVPAALDSTVAAAAGMPADAAAGSAGRSAALPPQPLWLLPEPQALTEQAHRPVLAGRPLQLLAGPERLETGWWDGRLALRDYFIAQAADGTLVWVFRTRAADPADSAAHWFLHGMFG